MRAVRHLVAGFLFLAVLSAVPSRGVNQLKRSIITGYVVDAERYPVANAVILVDNIKTYAVTDYRGFYKVKVKPDASKIGIISLNHGIIEEPINGRTRINFAFSVSVWSHGAEDYFKPEEEEINVGYGKVKRKNLTSSVYKINARNRQFSTFSSIYDMLQGVPGVLVSKGQVFIRGISSRFMYNEPLFVVDGTPVSSIADIPPQNVESIEVLKGSAGAIYGSRGANGVIQINQIGAPSYTDSSTVSSSRKLPVAVTRPATNIRKNSATLNGTVNASDLSTTVTFEYGTTPGHGVTISAAQGSVSGNIPVLVSADITGLQAGVTYYFRVVASNSLAKTTGADVTFRYTGEAPYAETGPATNTSPRAVQLNGIVNPGNIPTALTFEYGTTESYGNRVAADGSPVTGLNPVRVSANVTGLKPGTNYHYRIIAENDEGSVTGKDVAFKSEYVVGVHLFGGYIFYVDDTGEHGLVCAPTDQSHDALWGSCVPSGAAGREIGSGNQNTTDIVRGCPGEGNAAGICSDLELNGYDDWFLPSVDELMLMQANLDSKGLGGFEDTFYWSSTQDKHGAWVVNFFYGSKSNQSREKSSVRTRAIRAF
jgi:TonB-dependent SusC/RagA subfamily outer membrane receptor